jgi:hypothetical protein
LSFGLPINLPISLLNLGKIRAILQPLLDNSPIDLSEGRKNEVMSTLSSIKELVKVGYKNRYSAV